MDIFGGRPMLRAGVLAAVMAVCGFFFNITGKFLLALLLLLFILLVVSYYRLQVFYGQQISYIKHIALTILLCLLLS